MPLAITLLNKRLGRQTRILKQHHMEPYCIIIGTNEMETLIGQFAHFTYPANPNTEAARRCTYMGCNLTVLPGSSCLVLPAPETVLNEQVLLGDLIAVELNRQRDEDREALARYNLIGALPLVEPDVWPWSEGSD